MITHNGRSAIDEIFGFVQRNYEHQFEDFLPITHETQRLRAIRECYDPLTGWHSVIDASPQRLLDRGYDKVICVQRASFMSHCEAMAKYHRECFTIEDYIKLSLREPTFFLKLKRKYDKLNKQIDDPRYLRITLENWNNFTLQTFHDLLDFLGFPDKNRLYVIPYHPMAGGEARDFDAYSDSHISTDCELDKPVRLIREHG